MVRLVGDSDSVRRQNRALVLAALRSHGALSRTNLAGETGLSHASITAISQDMLAQGILVELPEETGSDRVRGRPALKMGFNRDAGLAVLIELDVNRARYSVVDYGGKLVDRFDESLPPNPFASTSPGQFLIARLKVLADRNPGLPDQLLRVAISVQGILDRAGRGLAWSPIVGGAGSAIADEIEAAFDVPVSLHKRGGLLAEGSRWLDPDLRRESVATIFIGSTVGMGLTVHGVEIGRGEAGATEFGHMNHLPDGARCRCGARGCIEAYAADYGVLRTAYSVPETASPAPSVPPDQYEALIARAQTGNRNAQHAFNLAGRAIGYGLSRMMSLFDPTHVRIVGPGANAFGLMRAEIEAALKASLVGKVAGLPAITPQLDETEPVFRGLMMKTLQRLDEEHFAGALVIGRRA